MKPGSVPTARIGPIIGELIGERWPFGGGVDVLADKVGCDWGAIHGVIKQEYEGCDYDLADKLLCALGRPDIWRGQLDDVYLEMTFLSTCALPSCSKQFLEKKIGYVKRYCSPRCSSLAGRVREGKATGERLRLKGKCLKGHKMTPENTRLRAHRNGTVERQCITCQRDYQREWARKRRATDPRFVERKQAAQVKWRNREPVAA